MKKILLIMTSVALIVSSVAGCGKQKKEISLGKAVQALGDSARGRFTRLEKSRTLNELWINLRGLVRLITSAKGPGIDYSMLARDIISWQNNRISVIRKWERDYYFKDTKPKKDENQEE